MSAPRNRPDSRQRDAAPRSGGSLLGAALRWMTLWSSRRPRATLCLVLVSAALAAGYSAVCLTFKTERADLIDPEADFHRRWIEFTRSFGDASDLVVVVEDDNPWRVRQALEDLGGRLERESELFTNVLYRHDTSRLRARGLQFFSPRELEGGLRRLEAYRPVINGRWEQTRLESLLHRLRAQHDDDLSRSPARGGGESRIFDQAAKLTESLARFLADPADFRSPWPDLLPPRGRRSDPGGDVVYLLNDDETMGFLKAVPVGPSQDFNGKHKAIARLRELIAEVRASHPSSRIGVTGIPVLEHDEMRRSQADMLMASIISFVGVGVILVVGFRGVRHPLLALLMLAIGMAWTFGYTTLAVGHLNILSVSFAVILIGLGVDFAIHYLARYLELRQHGHELRPALRDSSLTVGAGVVTAAVTTALAFFCATLTGFLGVAELGIIAGGGVLLCAVATFVVLPALVALADGNTEPRKLPTPFEGRPLRWLLGRCPRIVMFASLAVVAGVGSQALSIREGGVVPRVRYDNNLLNLQAAGVESVDLQTRLFHNAGDSLLYAVSIADNPEEARALRAKFEALPTVDHVEDLASLVPAAPHSETRLLIQAWRAELARLPDRAPILQGLNPAAVGRLAEELYLSLRRSRHPTAEHIARTLDWFLDKFETLSVAQQTRFLHEFQARTSAALLGQLQALAGATDPRPLSLSDLPPSLISRFRSAEGKWLLQIYPKEEVWDEEPLARFVRDVRSVDPEATGTPLQNYEASKQIRESYETASLYALAMIFLVLLVDFLSGAQKWAVLLPPLALIAFGGLMLGARRTDVSPVVFVLAYVGLAGIIAAVLDFRNLRDALLAMLPPIGGGLVMFGIMGLAGVDLNPANLIVLPLILGIGVDNGVHVVHNFRAQPEGYRLSASTMNAIVLTAFTSMVGFGSMLVAAHRGLSSVGLVLVVGVGSCLFVSLVTLPAILTVLAGPTAADASRGAQPASTAAASKPSQPAPIKRAA
ncbi:MAG TPA: MMPL family transporter [Planctomycetaceae bacterium]|nr:MMPL family transporter [Planctomycetaceae bacterium]